MSNNKQSNLNLTKLANKLDEALSNETTESINGWLEEKRMNKNKQSSVDWLAKEKPKVVHCKKEEFDVYIGRGSKWGNPFSHKEGTLAEHVVGSREEAIAKYEEYLLSNQELVDALPELKGKVLGCWCKPKACHGDVLLKLANPSPKLF